MKEDKVQTGLRIPQARYDELLILASQIGISLNALILMLIDLGLSARNGEVSPQQGSE